MESNYQQERQQAHTLLDLLPAAKVGAVRGLLEVMVDDDEELSEEDHAAIQAGLASLDKGRGVPMETVLADFGLTTVEFEKMCESSSSEKR